MNLEKDRYPTRDFKLFLQQELVGRCRKNPKYSLRAFAKSIGIAPSALSDMLNGKRSITENSIEKMGFALGLSPKEVTKFKTYSNKKAAGTTGASQLQFQQLTADVFALMSDWYYYAILELLKVKGFKPDPTWVAKALDLTKSEVNAALERLVRLNLLSIEKDGTWRDLSAGFSTNIEKGLTNSAVRNLQMQLLQQSLRALIEVPLDQRNHTSMTMAIDPQDMPLAIERIKEFRRSLCEELESCTQPKEVYQLSISLFPVTKIQELKKDKNL